MVRLAHFIEQIWTTFNTSVFEGYQTTWSQMFFIWCQPIDCNQSSPLNGFHLLLQVLRQTSMPYGAGIFYYWSYEAGVRSSLLGKHFLRVLVKQTVVCLPFKQFHQCMHSILDCHKGWHTGFVFILQAQFLNHFCRLVWNMVQTEENRKSCHWSSWYYFSYDFCYWPVIHVILTFLNGFITWVLRRMCCWGVINIFYTIGRIWEMQVIEISNKS